MILHFEDFALDLGRRELRRAQTAVPVEPQVFDLLAYLIGNRERVVTKGDLLEAIWNGRVVSESTLTTRINAARRALNDSGGEQRLIRTVARRGFRFVGEIRQPAKPEQNAASPTAVAELPTLVGRATDMDELRRRFDHALSGRRQLVFVTGEPGIGKSALVGAFVGQLAAGQQIRFAHGQCLDHHGLGEPYLPLIEAVTRLAGSGDGGAVKGILRTHAPSWLAQMPSLWTRAERGALEARARATRERMLRELTQAIEVLASDRPLLLQLEDIHWSDASTLDWLAHVARRPEPARFMVLATFRPADAAAISAGLSGITAELALHGHCHERPLQPLGLEAIEAYLAVRLAAGERTSQVREIAPLLRERTGGNPLFMVSIVSQLAREPTHAAAADALGSIPQDVRRFIEQQIDELDGKDRSLLAAASVVGREFATAAVGAALEADIEDVEADCARLARQGVFVAKSGTVTWPDGTNAELYAFRHDLYRELLYERLSATRRALCHARVAQRLEAAWANGPDAIAAELAEHFERGNERVRAIPHHQRAAAKALRRSANEEAIRHLRQALDAVRLVADDIERAKVEVNLRVALGAAYMAMRGFGAPEVLEAYAEAERLCETLGDRADIFPALWGQWLFRWGRSEMESARRLSVRLLALAEKSGNTHLRLQAHHAMWPTAFGQGRLAECNAHAEAGVTLYDRKAHQALASSYGNHDACCCARNFNAMSLALAGDETRARAVMDTALPQAQDLDDPFTIALTFYFQSAAAQILGDVELARRNAELSLQVAIEHDLALPRAWSKGVTGWCATESGEVERGLALMNEAVAALRATQSMSFLVYMLGLLADGCAKAGRDGDAMRTIEEAITTAEATGEHFYSAELYRLRGELLARSSSGPTDKAEASLQTAISLAHRQGALRLEARARESLRCVAG